jgi:hypothetical protein
MANTIIQLKNSGIPGNVPSILQPGELAINYTDGKLFYGNSINVATLFDAITEPSGLNGEIQFNNAGVFGASANLKYNTSTKTLSTDNILASVDITGNKLISNNSSGDEGGEILLAKPVSNTTLDGVGITIDSYQNRIRFFEQGGSARGAYIDLTQADGSAGTNLLGASADDFARLQANSAFNTANSATTTAQAGFNTANSATTTAGAAFTRSNSAFSTANSATTTAQAGFNHANGAFSTANSATTNAQSAFNKANSATTTAQAGFNHANGAFGTANTKLNSSGGTISGDLIISGNLTITGNTVTHSADDFIVNDPIVLLANNNPGNALDIGFVAHYEDGSANTKHTGLVRDVSAGVWYLFEDYIPHIQENNILNVSDASFRISTLSANIVTDVITVRGVDPLTRANSAYDQANSATTTSQAGFNTANSATTTAQAAFNTANSATTTAQAGFNHANGAFGIANSATTTAQAGFNHANGAFGIANSATTTAQAGFNHANGAFGIANSATTTAQAAFNKANSATTTAQAGFNHANGAFGTANTKFNSTGGTISGNIAVTGIVTINTHAVLESTTITTASISQTTLDTFATATYRSAKYLVQMTSGSAYHMIELSLIHDGTTVHLSQYGEVKTGSSLGSFDASISSGTLSVLFTPTNAITTVKTAITLLPV